MNRHNLPTYQNSMTDHCARALAARRWHCERRSLKGNWYFTFEDAARLRWTIGGAQAKQVLRRLGFELQPDRSWRTFDGPSQPLQLTVNFKTWAVLGGIARTFGGKNHPLSLVIRAESTLRVLEAESAISA